MSRSAFGRAGATVKTGLRKRGPVSYTHRMRPSTPFRLHAFRPPPGIVLAVLILAATAAGCAPGPGYPRSSPGQGWPYAGVEFSDVVPDMLYGRVIFTGRWLAAEPGGEAVYTETADTRFVCRVPFEDRGRFTFIDIGMGAAVEDVGFLDRGRSLFLVAGLTSPHHGEAVLVRSLLEVDLEGRMLQDTVPLDRSGVTRGMAVDPFGRRVFLLEDHGAGTGRVQVVDLYRGRVVDTAEVGRVPGRVGRKGLAVDQNVRHVFCLTGGESFRSDFEPIGPGGSDGPTLVVLDPDSLSTLARVPLDEGYEPLALAYDGNREQVYVLEVDRERSRLVTVDAVFHVVRDRVDLPEETTDLVVSGGYAFAPGAHGIYIVDLATETWISRPSLPFETTEEIAVSEDLSTAFVLFQTVRGGEGPGLAVVALQTGALLDVLR